MRRLGLSIIGVLLFATVNVPGGSNQVKSVVGEWTRVSAWGFSPIHMHVLPNGKVFMWDEDPGNTSNTWLWDPANETVAPAPGPPLNSTVVGENGHAVLFCSGHALLSDGRLFVVGGGHGAGAKVTETYIYDYSQGPIGAWTLGPPMTEGRWYPTVTSLPTGEAFIGGGDKGAAPVLEPEVLTPLNVLRRLPNITNWETWYPFQFVAPNGQIFRAGGSSVASQGLPTGYFNPFSGAWTLVAGSPMPDALNYGSAVMYEPGRVLRMGGGNVIGGCGRDFERVTYTTRAAEKIDLTSPTPSWSASNPMQEERMFANATILANGHVLVTGGQRASSDSASFVRQVESWNPSTGAGVWTNMATADLDQGYHSSAVLLPDGRVLIGGGRAQGCGEGLSWQVFKPPYLFQGNLEAARPAITSAPDEIHYGEPFFVGTDTESTTTAVTLVRLSSTTHHFNANQRFNRLTFTQQGTSMWVEPPASANLAPPGHYLLFVFKGGVPSVARIVRLVSAPAILHLNEDGLGDVLTYHQASGTWTRRLIQANGSFTENSGDWSAGAGWTVVAARFNEDALSDFFLFNTVSGQWHKVLSDGASGFTTQATGFWWPGWKRFVMDLNGDGLSDLFLYDPATGVWFKSLTNLNNPTDFDYFQGGWDTGWEITPMTLNSDAFRDLFLFNRVTGDWFWVLGAAGGEFTYPVSEFWYPSWNLSPGDFNADGLTDLLLHDPPTGAWFVSMNNGNGFTYTSGFWTPGWTPYVGDLDADDDDDLFLYSTTSGQWHQLTSSRTGAFSLSGSGGWNPEWDIYPTDFNADGGTDFLLYHPASGAWYQAHSTLSQASFTYRSGTWPAYLTIVAGSLVK